MDPRLTRVDDYPIPTLEEYLAAQPTLAEDAGGQAAPYAHPIDRGLIRALSRTALQHAVKHFVQLAIDARFTPLWQHSVPVAARSFPELNRLRAEAAAALGIAVPELYVGALAGYGAIFTVGTDERHFIFVDSTWLSLAEPDEILFVLGHECGHIQNRHVTYHTLAVLLLEGGATALRQHPALRPWSELLRLLIGPALAAWARRSEITGDRAGLLTLRLARPEASEEWVLATAQRSLVRLLLGFARDAQVEIDAYLDDMRRRSPDSLAARYSLLTAAHPLPPHRLEALRLFHDSELYYECARRPRPERPLLATRELNERVDDLIAVL